MEKEKQEFVRCAQELKQMFYREMQPLMDKEQFDERKASKILTELVGWHNQQVFALKAEHRKAIAQTWKESKTLIERLTVEIERKDEALRNIKIGAKRIQNLSYGFDSVKYAESIEDLAEQALSEEE